MDVTTLLTDLASVFHGTTVNKIPNIYGHINRAARQVLQDVDPKETQRIVELAQIFNDVFDYAAPVDLKGDRIVDLRLQAGRLPSDVFYQQYGEDFDANKLLQTGNTFYTQWNTGVKTLRINAPFLIAPTTICDTGSVTGWTATTGAQNISLDTQYNVAGGGALQFDLAAGSSSGYIENSTLTALDLTSHVDISTLFLWVYMPTASSITSVNLRWGTDSSNYYSYTATVTQQNTVFQNGWNLLAFPWVSATKTGTPTNTTYQYVRATFNYNSTLQTGVKIDNLVSALGFIFELQYYSKYIFRDPSTNVFQETVNSSADNGKLINLDTDSYNLLFNKAAFYVAQALQGADAGYDATYWDSEYKNALTRYKGLNPAEAILKRTSYYTLPNKNYNRFGGYGPYNGPYNN
jgi:hypothetical protein